MTPRFALREWIESSPFASLVRPLRSRDLAPSSETPGGYVAPRLRAGSVESLSTNPGTWSDGEPDCCAFFRIVPFIHAIGGACWNVPSNPPPSVFCESFVPGVGSHAMQRSQISRSANAPRLTCPSNLVWLILLMQAARHLPRPAFECCQLTTYCAIGLNRLETWVDSGHRKSQISSPR